MIRLKLSSGNKDVIEAFVKRALPKIGYHLVTPAVLRFSVNLLFLSFSKQNLLCSMAFLHALFPCLGDWSFQP